MKNLARTAIVLSALCCAPLMAAPVIPQVQNAGGYYVPAYGVQEQIQLATANVAAVPQAVFGGTYIFAQMGTGYGTDALQVLGPDLATWETIASKTQTDSTGGTELRLQAGAVVRVLLTGTTGIVATLAREP